MRFHRLTLRDWIVNLYLRWRFNRIRNKEPYKLYNYSFKHKYKYLLIFEDDFDKISWNRSDPNRKWGIGEDWGPYHPGWLNKYFGEPNLNGDSCAVFSVKYKPKEFIQEDGTKITIPYVASWLNTVHSFTQQYGRFECRMTLPKEKGSWPAFWLWGPTHPPEIDVIEAYGRDTGEDIVYQEINVHWRTKSGKHVHINPWRIKIDDYDEHIADRFHEFVLEWDEKGMYFYTDGIKVFEFTNKKVLNRMYNADGIKPFMLINNNIMKNIDGSDKDYHSEFKVDYVRAYRKRPD